MKVGEVCQRGVVTIDRGRNLRDAAAMMREHGVGALVVTESTALGMQACGVVSERDLVTQAMASGVDPARFRVGDLGQRRLISVCSTDRVDEAIAAMHQANVRWVLVTTPDRRLEGCVTMDDLLDAVAGELTGLIGAIRSGLEHEPVQSGPWTARSCAIAVPAP